MPEDDLQKLEERLRKLLGEDAQDADTDLEKRAEHLSSEPFPTRDDVELDPKIGELENRLKAARENHQGYEAKIKQESRSIVGSEADAKSLGTGVMAAYAMLGVPMAGALLGFFVDKGFGTHLISAFVLGGIVLAGIFLVFLLKNQA